MNTESGLASGRARQITSVFSFVRPCYNDGMKNDAIDRVKLPKPPRKNTGTVPFIIIGGAILAYSIGAIIWEYYTYGQEMQQYEEEVAVGQHKDATPEQRQLAEGKDETDPPADVLAGYTVEPTHPRAIYIDKIGVRAKVLPMSLNPDRSIQAPINIFDAGWYTESAVPSRAGAVVIDAHASGPTREGLFAYLDTLTKGDTIEVETGDGTRYTYRVVATETVKLEDVDMKKLMLPYGTATHGANFITCAGDWLEGSETFNERAVVYTELVS